jgi:Domain of unknown function DUF29
VWSTTFFVSDGAKPQGPAMATAPPEQLYESDFYAWTQEQAKELRRLARTRPNAPLDLAHIAEEIQDLGKSEYETAFSLTQRIIEHLILLEHSPATGERLHWCDEIDDFRDRSTAGSRRAFGAG